MSKAESLYRASISSMTPKERAARGFSLHLEIHEMLEWKFSKEFPQLPIREIKKKVAQRMYLRDKRTQDLLNRIP